jgi:hypothetical protein
MMFSAWQGWQGGRDQPITPNAVRSAWALRSMGLSLGRGAMKSIIHSTKALFQIRFLRNILLASLGGTLSMPLIVQFAITPQFANYLVSITEDDSRRIAAHLAQGLDVSTASLSSASLPREFVTQSDSGCTDRLAQQTLAQRPSGAEHGCG